MKGLLFIVLLFSIKASAQQIPYYDAAGRSRTSGSGTVNQILTNSGGGLMSWQPLPTGAVTSVFGRSGTVVATTNDYTFSQIGSTPTTIAGYGITDFNSLGDARWLPLAGGTLTGTVNSRTIQPSATLTYSLGGVSNVYVVNYTQQVTNPAGNLSVVAGGANSIIYSSNGVTQERMYTTGNHVSQNGGTFADGGYRYDIVSAGTNGYFRAGNFVVDASGNGTATTQAAGDNSTKLASTAYVDRNEILLAAITGINTKNTGATALYTVPTGKTVIVTKVAIRVTSATAITTGPTVDIGVTAGDIYASTALTALTSLNKVFGFFSTGISMAATTTQVINLNINTPAVGTSQVVECLIYGNLR